MRGRVLQSMIWVGALSLALLVASTNLARANDSSGSGSIPISAATTTGPPATATSMAALRAAAASWATTFLTGTPEAIRGLQGPECRSNSTGTTLPKATVDLYLRGLRASMRRALGRPLTEVHVRDVELRNVTANRGEAQAIYDLPQQKVGNDNWVEFTLHRGHWKVSNCQAPILGHSTSSSPGTATAIPAESTTTP
jgi:hypothetical protein